jgi:ABC-type transporter Mla MlaB component
MNPAVRRCLTREAMDEVFVCDVGALVEPDVAAVDALARLQLAARRSGCRIALQGMAPALGDLLELMGLTEVLPWHGSPGGSSGASALEPRRQPEQREQPLGVEEEADARDRAVTDLDDL